MTIVNGTAAVHHTSDPVQRLLDRLERQGYDPRPSGDGKWRSRCPGHKGDSPSLSINVGSNGAVLIHCNRGDGSGKCSPTAILAELKMELKDLFAPTIGLKPSASKTKKVGWDTPLEAAVWQANKLKARMGGDWAYRDRDGTIYAHVYRFNTPDGKKDFRPVSRDPDTGRWLLKDPPRWLPYGIDEVLNAPRLYLHEGEKCREIAAKIGIPSITTAHGCKSPAKTDLTDCADKEVIITPDVGEAGEAYVSKLVKLLGKLDPPARVKVLRLPDLADDGDDIEQFVEARQGATAEELRAEIEALADALPYVGDPDAAVEVGPKPLSNGHHPSDGAAQDKPSANPKGPPKALKAPDDPHRLARVIRDLFVDAAGNRTLACYRANFYVWDGSKYRLDPIFISKTVVDESKAEIDRQNIAAIAAYMGDGALPVAKKVTTGLVKNVVQALAAMCSIDREGDAPFWIKREEGDPDPRDLIPARNGLVDIRGADPVLIPHSPRFFSTHALGYDFKPDAPAPEKWNAFLRDQWPDDDESIYTLHEVLGDMLVPTEGVHALHLWIGPPRSGRGTMREVASDLVGRWNVTATSPVSLSSAFGLESLLDKKLAVMGDARTGDSHDSAVMMDRLLRITGGDPVEVNRKGRPILPDVRMNLRVLVISNEMPNFRDSSGAIVSRYVVLATTKTIPKEERNPRLAEELKAELPGILNEAIKSLKTLRLRKYFLQPKSSDHLIDDAGDIASPVRVFVTEKKFPVGPSHSVVTATLFDEWKYWAIANGYQVGNIGTFGKNLKATYPQIRKTRPRDGDKQVSTYEGIGAALPPL